MNRLKKWYRAATASPSVTFTLVLAYPTFVMAILGSPVGKSFDFFDLILLVGLGLPVTILLICFSGWFALRSMEPEKYAEIVIGNSSATEALRVLAQHSYDCLMEFHHEANEISKRELEDLLEMDADGIHTGEIADACTAEQLEAAAKMARKLVIKQRPRLERIVAMKRLAAIRLNIPIRRLCDHILQYGPRVHGNRTQVFADNLSELHNLKMIGPEEKQKHLFLEKLAQNRRIRKESKRRAEYQKDLIQRPIDRIIELGRTHSASTGLQLYAEILGEIASKIKSLLDPSVWDGDPHDPRFHQAEDELMFIFRKQRAYPGYNLNAIMIAALTKIKETAEASVEDKCRRIIGLLKLAEGRSPEEDGFSVLLPGPGRKTYELLESQGDEHRSFNDWVKSETFENVNALKRLSNILTNHQMNSRAQLLQNFQSCYSHWTKTATIPQNRLLISHGYSRTVRDALCSALGCFVPHSVNERIFLLATNQQTSFQARMMKYEIKEVLGGDGKIQIGIGETDALRGILDPGDHVLLIIGTEAFDENRKTIHPRGLENLFSVADELKIQLATVAVAEEYKKCTESLAYSDFFDDHFDRMRLYGPNEIEFIITDSETGIQSFRDQMGG